jgi:ABC-type uncharacterized transport system substrate-binding protein
MIRGVLGFAFVTLVAGLGALGLAGAQQPNSPRRIGVLLVGWSPEQNEVQEFRRGLLDAGYVEGRHVAIEWRTANGDYARVPPLLADLIQRKVDVIVLESTVAPRRRSALRPPSPSLRSSWPIQSDPAWLQLLRILAEMSPGSRS